MLLEIKISVLDRIELIISFRNNKDKYFVQYKSHLSNFKYSLTLMLDESLV